MKLQRLWNHFRPESASDPTLAIASRAEALDAALTLLNNATPRSAAAALWANAAYRPLAALLYTASPRGNGQGITWVRTVANSLRNDGTDAWSQAEETCTRTTPDPVLTQGLARAALFDHRQRDSIAEAIATATGLPPQTQLVKNGCDISRDTA